MVRQLILYTFCLTCSSSKGIQSLLVRCESHCPVCFLSLLFSTRRVLYGHPLGFGPTAKPIRLECCSSLGVAAGKACFQTWMAVWVSLIQQLQQHRCAGCRVDASRMVAIILLLPSAGLPALAVFSHHCFHRSDDDNLIIIKDYSRPPANLWTKSYLLFFLLIDFLEAKVRRGGRRTAFSGCVLKPTAPTALLFK